ncbi:hypothetical protein PI124_g19275 [Phytophthora idaei]|nr:hypothetical protein PI124_g19275 [Phytophthora idaei]
MDLSGHVNRMGRNARYEVARSLDVLENGHVSLLQPQESGPLDSLILRRLEREPQVGLHRCHGREAGGVGDQLAEGPFLRLPRQLREKEASPRELGRKLPSFNRDVHLAEPSVEVKATVAFATIPGDIELDDVGQRGSRDSLTEVSKFTCHELLGGQALLSFRADRQQGLDDSLAGRRCEAV